ncbi:MAG: hypothetical protein CSA50_02340 [Gammaproteobacteria bacterium]|nr:MAG: hypothetical protein CSA50_02340 [Gammaproteobacteria bacterium]
MTIFSKLLALIFIFMFIACFLYVVFGQVTVRRLRKNLKTKDALGLEFVSGWDIINVAQALAFPTSWINKLEESRISFLYANAKILRENTTRLDRILGSVFYWTMMLSGLAGALLVLLNSLGFIPE